MISPGVSGGLPTHPDALSSDELRKCSKCDETKPLGEFYERSKGSGDRLPYCRDCDNAKPRKRNVAKLVRLRGRARAVAELVKRHDDEFRDLLEYFTSVAAEEAEQIAGRAHEGEAPRLRPGAARPGQTVTERIDVSRCPHCVKAHDNGHACPKCGTKPAEPLPHAPGVCPACSHPLRRHDPDQGCLIGECECAGSAEDLERAS